jgi:hypothetical protein
MRNPAGVAALFRCFAKSCGSFHSIAILKPPHPPAPSPPEEEKGSKNIKCRNQFAIVIASKDEELE